MEVNPSVLAAHVSASPAILPMGALAVCKNIDGKFVVEPIRTSEVLLYTYAEPLSVDDSTEMPASTGRKKQWKSPSDLVQCRLCRMPMSAATLANRGTCERIGRRMSVPAHFLRTC